MYHSLRSCKTEMCFGRVQNQGAADLFECAGRALYEALVRPHSMEMAVLKIARMGHPVLRARAAEVDDPTDPEIARLVADMIETLDDAGGVGLAAPQVYVPRRVVVFYVPAERLAPDETPVPMTVLINPVIEPLGEDVQEQIEGCLSIPDMIGRVPRYTRIGYGALGLDGKRMEREVSGFHARVVQHECDHLDGRLYPMRMADLSTFGFVDEFRRGAELASRHSEYELSR